MKNAKALDASQFKRNIRSYENQGFVSLMPTFEEQEEDKLKDFIDFKSEDRQKIQKSLGFRAKSGDQDAEIDIDNDDVIADPHFASVLNRNRELELNGKIYKYTEKGLLYTEKDNYNNLLKAANLLIEEPIDCLEPLNFSSLNVNHFAVANCGSGGGIGCTNCGGGGVALTREEIRDNLKVCKYDPNIWDGIFGPSEDCIDNYSDRTRIKTRAWSQNFFVYASVGITAKTQKKYLGAWWANKVDEIELGYSTVAFQYNAGSLPWPKFGTEIQFEYGDYIVNQYGNIISYNPASLNHPQNLFDRFPINNKDGKILEIYLFTPLDNIFNFLGVNYDRTKPLDLTNSDVNKGVQKLVQLGVNTLKSKGKQLNSSEAVIVYPTNNDNTINFLFTNFKEIATNENQIQRTFDWNTAQIGFKTKGKNVTPTFNVSRKYDKFDIVCYGMGRAGSTWRGSRIVLSDTK
ncbi:MAG: hypothetical protein HC880_07935 [Bacteroidia bacterium]|nr:hypothetical protein [Bacteroidia bacterium]